MSAEDEGPDHDLLCIAARLVLAIVLAWIP